MYTLSKKVGETLACATVSPYNILYMLPYVQYSVTRHTGCGIAIWGF